MPDQTAEQPPAQFRYSLRKEPSVDRKASPIRIIWKRCVTCEQYFEGELNGEYRCRTCRTEGIQRLPALAPLGDLDHPLEHGRRIA